jgi:teichoic acid transport system permease protein
VARTEIAPEVPEDLRPPSSLELPEDPTDTWPELYRVGVALPIADYVRELWRRREFAYTVPMGELRAQNQDTMLGQLWHLINPLLMVGVYYFIFGVVLDAGGRGGIDNFIGFLLVGVFTFEYTRKTVQAGSRMIVKNRKLVQSINFPRAILPVSALVSETTAYFWAVPVMWTGLLLTGEEVQVTWLLVVPIVLVQGVFNLGAAMIVARISFHFRDVAQFLPYVMRIWLYMSGVIFPITGALVPAEFLPILQANPAYNYIEMARSAFIDGRFVAQYWVWGVGWALASFLLGFWLFRRAEAEYGRV